MPADVEVLCSATDAGREVASGHVLIPAGFYALVDNLPKVNVVTPGSTVPVKFSLGGYRGTAIFKAGFPVSVGHKCPGMCTKDNLETVVARGPAALTYERKRSSSSAERTNKRPASPLAGGRPPPFPRQPRVAVRSRYSHSIAPPPRSWRSASASSSRSSAAHRSGSAALAR